MALKTSSFDRLPTLHRGVLLTVLYGDLFDHPLTPGELQRFLVVRCPDRETLMNAVRDLERSYLSRAGELVCWRGRETTVKTRRRREELATPRWPPARRFARWLSWVPFLRMVAVCGSQAMENGESDGDIDLFLITDPGRLWLVQAITMTLRRVGGLLRIDLCPNYLMTTDSLAIERHNLYTAREAAQVVPLWGDETYEDFLAANPWILSFLPQLDTKDRRRFLEPRRSHRTTALLERCLGGALGDGLDRLIHRILLRYYRFRLRRHGWTRDDITSAYRRDRQMVITGGYAKAVAQRFVEHGVHRLGDEPTIRDALRRCFFGKDSPDDAPEQRSEEAPDALYAGLMATRYGGGIDG